MTNYILILQSHLPLVRHPEHERFLEERWLFEAISETYLPLLRVMDRLAADSVPFRLAMSFSPTLSFMLQDQFLMDRYRRYLDSSLELAERECGRTRGDHRVAPLANMYRERYQRDRHDLNETYAGNILAGFAAYAKRGNLELLAGAATHAFLPHYRDIEELVRAQIELGIESHRRTFGEAPSGFWLPECGYYEGLDKHLADCGVRYFVSSAHGVLFGNPMPSNGTYAPVRTPRGVATFPRDVYTADWVWSNDHGFPADAAYRDFYRDVGYDLPLEYVAPYIHDDGIRIPTGLKYHAITGDTDDKAFYQPELAARRVREQAAEYVRRLRYHAERLETALPTDVPVVTSAFDTELFGHWWFEGPDWIEALMREFAAESSGMTPTLPSNYLQLHGTYESVEPSFSSWGSRGYAEVWLDGSNDWINRHIHAGIERLADVVARFPDESGLKERALNQAAREVLLAMASDWPFILNANTVVSYAKHRVTEHLTNLARIIEELSRQTMGTEWLTKLEKAHPVMPFLNYRRFAFGRVATVRELI